MSITLDFKQATELLEAFNGEPALITVFYGTHAKGETEALKLFFTEHPEEGCLGLGVTDEDARPESKASDEWEVMRKALGILQDFVNHMRESGRPDTLDLVRRAEDVLAAAAALTPPAEQPLNRDSREAAMNERLLAIIANTYQILGALDAPTHILDVLIDPIGATDAQLEAMLPFAPAAPDAEQEPAATVFTMEPLVPGGTVRCHAQMHMALPAGTKLYAYSSPTLADLRAKVDALQRYEPEPTHDSVMRTFAYAKPTPGRTLDFTERRAGTAGRQVMNSQSDAGGAAAMYANLYHEAKARVAELDAELNRLRALINTPQTKDWMVAVETEAAHQQERWGSAHDAGKEPQDWFWLLGYLSGKALAAFAKGDREKGLHHIVSSAAVLRNWHLHTIGERTAMRPGIDPVARGIDAAMADSKEAS